MQTWFWPAARVFHARAHSSAVAFGGEPFERLAEARHDAVGRRLGARRAALDDALQAITFGSRIGVKRRSDAPRRASAASGARGPRRSRTAPRMRRGEALAAVVAVAAIVVGVVLLATSGGASSTHGGAAADARAPPTAPMSMFGVNVNRLFNDRTYTPAQIDAQLAALQATGATIARSDALWEASEPDAPQNGGHQYDWAFDDRVACSLADHGLPWLPIIDYSAPGRNR